MRMRRISLRRSFPTRGMYSLRQGKKRWKQRLNCAMAAGNSCREQAIRLNMQNSAPLSSRPRPGEKSWVALLSWIAASLRRYCLQGPTSLPQMYSSKLPSALIAGSLPSVSAARSMAAAAGLSCRSWCRNPSHLSATQTDLEAAAISLSTREASLRRSGLSSAARHSQRSKSWRGLKWKVKRQGLLKQASSSCSFSSALLSICYRQTIYYMQQKLIILVGRMMLLLSALPLPLINYFSPGLWVNLQAISFGSCVDISSHNFLKGVVPNRKNQNLMLQLKTPYQKVSRTFVFEKEQTMQSEILDLEIEGGIDPIDLAPILTRHCPLKSRICLYDPSANAFLPLRRTGKQGVLVARRLLEPSVILVRYREKEEATESEGSGSDFEAESGERRDMRSRERTVGEAIDLVKRWRGLHLSCPKPNNTRKKVNLQEAARMLGVSKKSLDDYYCQLRLAEQYGFDFDKHLHEKMGALRSFVKDCKTDQERQQLRPHRHPKHLRVIEDFELEARLLAHLARNNGPAPTAGSAPPKKAPSPPRSTAEVGTGASSSGLKEINALEEDYYRGFEFVLDDPSDPFLALNKDFSKRMLEDDSDPILFL